MHNLINALGIIGGCCFAWCGVPLAWATIRAGKSLGTPILTAGAILLGAVTMYLYLLGTYGVNWLLTLNYSIEIASWTVVVVAHFTDRCKP